MTTKPTKPTSEEPSGTVRLAVPWGRPSNFEHSKPGLGWGADQGELDPSANGTGVSTDTYIRERTRLHETYILEQARTQRLGLVLAFLLILLAATLVVFAPTGRESISYWIGFALVIFAAGASGYGRVWGKTSGLSFGAGTDSHPANTNDSHH